MKEIGFNIGKSKFVKTDDDAFIYYQDIGKGNAILLVHGWSGTSGFWRRNVWELSKHFRVVTMDFRGHGSSSKGLQGHTIPIYAKDIRLLIRHLELSNVALVGWSMGVPVVLSYYEQFGDDNSIKAIGLIDGTPAPFVDEDWNYHRMKKSGGDTDKMNKEIVDYVNNPREFAAAKANGWFKEGWGKKEDIDWIVDEILKTPPWISYAIFTDFLHRNYTHILPRIKLPAIVFSPKEISDRYATGKYIADKIPGALFTPIDAGHLLFYEKSEEFNAKLRDFANSL